MLVILAGLIYKKRPMVLLLRCNCINAQKQAFVEIRLVLVRKE